MKYEIEDRGQFKMIHIIGNIDSSESTKILDNEISRLIRQGNHHFVFNLERTTFLDSGGISLFIHCLCDVQENKGSMFIIAEENQVRRVLEIVGINRLIKTYYSEKDFFDAHKLPKRDEAHPHRSRAEQK
ncbi:MAG: STAS domain-containing protein [Chitinispirillaceae bacterium]|jgi:anti-anti-sigma factor